MSGETLTRAQVVARAVLVEVAVEAAAPVAATSTRGGQGVITVVAAAVGTLMAAPADSALAVVARRRVAEHPAVAETGGSVVVRGVVAASDRGRPGKPVLEPDLAARRLAAAG